MVSYIKGGVAYSYRLRVFEKRRTFEPKRNVNGEWRRLHNEEPHSLYRSPNIVRVIKSRRLRWTGHVVKMEVVQSAYKVLTGMRPRHWWKDNIIIIIIIIIIIFIIIIIIIIIININIITVIL